MNNFYNEQWYTDRWNSLPYDLKRKAVEAVRNVLSEDDANKIRLKHEAYGRDWIHHLIDTTWEERYEMDKLLPADKRNNPEYGWPLTMSAHHGWGTNIRNLLRDSENGAGISDNQLPPAPYENGHTHQNWDDMYVQVIEAAVGLR
jgi:hypothetical protein